MIRKWIVLTLIVALISGLSAHGAWANSKEDPPKPKVQKQYIVKYRDSEAERKNEKKYKHERKYGTTSIHMVKLTDEEVQNLLSEGDLLFLEEDRQVEVLNTSASSTAAADWALDSIDAPVMHESHVKGQGVQVAVLDTGIAVGLLQLPVRGGTSVLGGGWEDDHGHGTQVASVIGARGGDGALLGVAPEADLYAVKVLDATGKGSISDVLAGMEWAVENQMDIVVMAFGTPEDSQALQAAVQDMYSRNILVVAAAGNTAGATMAPARYTPVVAVGAYNVHHQISAFSARDEAVTLYAPGEAVPTLDWQGKVRTDSGTSLATGYVAGAAALVWSNHPDYRAGQVNQALQVGAIPLTEVGVEGARGLNTFLADSATVAYLSPTGDSGSDIVYRSGAETGSVSIQATHIVNVAPNPVVQGDSTTITWRYDDTDHESTKLEFFYGDELSPRHTDTIGWTVNKEGTYIWQTDASTSIGQWKVKVTPVGVGLEDYYAATFIQVSPPPPSITVSASPSEVYPAETSVVTFALSTGPHEVTVETYRQTEPGTFVGAEFYQNVTANVETPFSFSATIPGTYRIVVKVLDKTAETTVTVLPYPDPRPTVDNPIIPPSGSTTVRFSYADERAHPTTVTVLCSDGSTDSRSTGTQVSGSYALTGPSEGSCTVRVVPDDYPEWARSVTVSVLSLPEPNVRWTRPLIRTLAPTVDTDYESSLVYDHRPGFQYDVRLYGYDMNGMTTDYVTFSPNVPTVMGTTSLAWNGLHSSTGYAAWEGNAIGEVTVTDLVTGLSATKTATIAIKPYRIPVLYMPGITGTEIWSDVPGYEVKLWPPTIKGLGNDILRLRLDHTGNPVEASSPRDVIAWLATADFGDSLFWKLRRSGYTMWHTPLGAEANVNAAIPTPKGINFIVAGYDWRFKNETHLATLDMAVRRLIESSGSHKVVLMGHSMGGLIARKYVTQYPGASNRVLQVFTIASPLLGTPSAIQRFYNGDNIHWIVDIPPNQVRVALRTMPSAYQLMPTERYQTLHGRSFFYDRQFNLSTGRWEDVPISIASLKVRLGAEMPFDSNTSVTALAMIQDAASFHDGIDGVAMPVPWEQFVGTGVATTTAIRRSSSYYDYEMKDCSVEQCVSKETYEVIIGNGDGTVTVESATDLVPHTRRYLGQTGHGSIPADSRVVTYLDQWLLAESTGSPKPAWEDENLSLSTTEVRVACPVDVHVYDDETGRHSGPTTDGWVEYGIPEVQYHLSGPFKQIFIPDNGKTYRIELVGTGTGVMDVSVIRYENDQVIRREMMQKIDVTDTLRGTITVPANRTGHVLQLNPDSSGSQTTISPTLIEGTALADDQPPRTTAQVSGEQGQPNWYRTPVTLELAAADVGGSGVYETYSNWANGSTPGFVEYTTPLTFADEGDYVVLAGSSDNAGNNEPYPLYVEFHIDKTLPTVTAALDRAPDFNGWYNQDVTVSFAATDAFAGIHAVDQPKVVTTDGLDLVIEGSATDRAGNVSTASVTFKLDKSAPVTTLQSTPMPPAGTVARPVQVSLSAEDNLSGVSRTEYSLDGGQNWVTYTVPMTLDSDANEGIMYRSFDQAGNQEIARSAFRKDGLSLDTAYVFHPPGPQAGTVTYSGGTWYKIYDLEAHRSFVLSAVGGTGISFVNSNGAALSTSCTGSNPLTCSFTPPVTGTYYAKVTGQLFTLSSVDGSTQSLAWGPVPVATSGGPAYAIPANEVGWSGVNLAANSFYKLNVYGAKVITVWKGSTQVATVTGTSLLFKTVEAGLYHVEVSAGTTNRTYALSFPKWGPIYVPHGPHAGTIGSSGSTWYLLEGSSHRRTFALTITGGTGARVYLPDGTLYRDCTGTDPAVCFFQYGLNGMYQIEVLGAPNAPIILWSTDGSTQELAHDVPAPLTTSAEYLVPDSSSNWFKVNLPANTYYGLYVPDAISIALFKGTTQVAAVTGSRLNFASLEAGTYHVKVTGGTLTASQHQILNWYAGGGSQQTAQIHTPLTEQVTAASETGATWFKLDGLTINRTFVMKVEGASAIQFTNSYGTIRGSCTTASPVICSFIPSQVGTYYATVTSAANAPLTLTSWDGSTQELAYQVPPAPTTSPLYYVNSYSTNWFEVDLQANRFYGLSIPAATSVSVYKGTTLVGTATGDWLNFTSLEAGAYHVKATSNSTTASGKETLYWYDQGAARQSAFPYTTFTVQNATATATGTTWFQMDGLKKERSFVLTVTGATNITFTDSQGFSVFASCSTTTPKVCRITPSRDGTYYASVTSAANAPLSLSSVDGSTQELAYEVPPPPTTSVTYYVPSYSTNWFKVELQANTEYGLAIPAATSVSVYMGTTLVGTNTGGGLNFTSLEAGTYHVKATSDSTTASGKETLYWYDQGAVIQTALALPKPGPYSTTALASGTTWFKLYGPIKSRSYVLTVTGATTVTFTNSTGATQTTSCTTTTPKVCTFSPSYDGAYYAKVTSAANAPLTLWSADGLSEVSAYEIPAAPTSSPAYRIPAYSASWYKVTLVASTNYGLSISGATGVTLYRNGVPVATVSGSVLSFTSLDAGTYYVVVQSGSSSIANALVWTLK